MQCRRNTETSYHSDSKSSIGQGNAGEIEHWNVTVCMANQRARSLSELGPLNMPGEVAVSTKSLETTKTQAYWEPVAGPSGWCTWLSFKDDGGI